MMYGPLICHTLPASVQRTFVNACKVAINLKKKNPSVLSSGWNLTPPPSVIEGLNDSKVYVDAFVKFEQNEFDPRGIWFLKTVVSTQFWANFAFFFSEQVPRTRPVFFYHSSSRWPQHVEVLSASEFCTSRDPTNSYCLSGLSSVCLVLTSVSVYKLKHFQGNLLRCFELLSFPLDM